MNKKLKTKNIFCTKCTTNKRVCFDVIFMINGKKMRLKTKNRSQRYDINRPRLGLDMDPNILNIKCASV